MAKEDKKKGATFKLLALFACLSMGFHDPGSLRLVPHPPVMEKVSVKKKPNNTESHNLNVRKTQLQLLSKSDHCTFAVHLQQEKTGFCSGERSENYL